MSEEVNEASAPVETVKAKTIHVTVDAGEAREFPISVFPGCFLEYSFHTKGGDIGFGILLETPGGELKTVLERERVTAHQEALNGKIRCTQNGTLWFMWDNSHSWFTAKELVYSVTRQPNNLTVKPEDTEVKKDSVASPIEKTSPAVTPSGDSTPSPPKSDEVIPPPPPLPTKSASLSTNTTSPTPSNTISSTQRPIKVILGSMTMSSQVGLADSVEIIRKFISLDTYSQGIHELDTARMYNKGKTEIMLGDLFKQHSDLLKVISIASKANPFKAYNQNLRPENILKQMRDSLSALQQSSIDIFYLHAPDHLTNIEDSLEAVNDLYLAGKFRQFGLSNYAAWEVMEIWHICERNDWVKPTVYQGMYNPITREVESELLPCLRRLNMKFYAYNPLAGGLLSGKYTSGQTNTQTLLADIPDNGRFSLKSYKHYGQRFWKRDYLDSVFFVQTMCKQEGISLCEASLRWIAWNSKLSSKFKDGIIIGITKLQHLEQNMAALTLDAREGPLPQSIVDAFDKAWLVCKGSCPKYNR